MRIRDLLERQSVCINASPVSKEDAVSRLVDAMASTGCINDIDRFREDVFERERKSSTGLGEGIAIPHAKSPGVDRPGLAAMVVPNGVDFDSIDGEPVHLIFMIASPNQASDAHLDVLARLSTLLIDEHFRSSLLSAHSVDEFLEAIDSAESEEDEKEASEQARQEEEADSPEQKKGYDIVAVTACPAGLSHTYMAAEALEQKAREMGLTIKVEADGAAGNRNSLMPEDIASARAVIVAADRAVDIDRFAGKPMVRTGVVDGVHRPGELIKKALSPDCPVYRIGGMSTESTNLPMKLYRHLMSGLTYILPLAATAGILSAVARLEFVKTSSLGLFLDSIGYSIGSLLFPVLSAFIAFSMAGRMALVAGFTGGVMADMASAGVIGALLNGFVGGGVAFVVARIAQRFLKGHDAMFALLVYPLAGAVLTTLIAQFITNLPAALIDNVINDFISDTSTITLVAIGAVLAGMMSADMGGPFNKLAYASGVLLLADCLPENGPGSMVMASVMLGGMVPPMAAGVAARFIAPGHFAAREREAALSAIFKGLLFITEAVLPFLTLKRLRLACVTGSAVAGGMSMFFHCGICAPHGGIFLFPLATEPLFYIVSLLGGVLSGALMFAMLSPNQAAVQAEAQAAAAAAAAEDEAAREAASSLYTGQRPERGPSMAQEAATVAAQVDAAATGQATQPAQDSQAEAPSAPAGAAEPAVAHAAAAAGDSPVAASVAAADAGGTAAVATDAAGAAGCAQSAHEADPLSADACAAAHQAAPLSANGQKSQNQESEQSSGQRAEGTEQTKPVI